jgi:hypothetical protein
MPLLLRDLSLRWLLRNQGRDKALVPSVPNPGFPDSDVRDLSGMDLGLCGD